jgi:hypothetical protein
MARRNDAAITGEGKVHVLGERTAKRYKLMQALGTIGFFVGVGMAIYTARNSPTGTASGSFAPYVLLAIASAAMNIFGRVLAWWHHA